MNQVALIGRLTKDPELRLIGEQWMQTSFTLAVNRSFKNQQGEIGVDFILCTIWGRTAENTVKHCGKGSLVGVSGRIQARSYEKEGGSRAYVTEVVCEDVRFLVTKKPTNAESTASEEAATERTAASEHFELPEDNGTKETLPIF